MNAKLETLLTVEQAARLVNVSHMTIRRWRDRGKLIPLVIGGHPFFEPAAVRRAAVYPRRRTQKTIGANNEMANRNPHTAEDS
jgi:excisionase family DNA binding protein